MKPLNYLYWFVMSALLLYSCFMAGRCYEAYQHSEIRKADARAVVHQKMKKKHGTPYAYEERGVWYFDRKGKKCRL